jgi:hypothetical protein
MRIVLNQVNIDGTIVIGEGKSTKRQCSISVKKSVPAKAMRWISPSTRLKAPA